MKNLYIYSRKKRDTPTTEMTAPTTARKVMGWWKSQREGRRMRMGVVAISVLAMPAAVCCTAIKEKPTPMNGPLKTAIIVARRPRRSLRLSHILPAWPLRMSQAEKHSRPATQRIIFDAKGRTEGSDELAARMSAS